VSGPVTEEDAPAAVADASHPIPACVEVTDSHEAEVGRFRVRRALPRAGRRTVGAWCFADHMGPADVTEDAGLDVGPHPHIGLQTVTWLTDGQVLHRDSLGTEQVIAPGQLNLMTSGGGLSHSEEATGHYRGTLEGIQLWVALPEADPARAGRVRAPRRAAAGRPRRRGGDGAARRLRELAEPRPPRQPAGRRRPAGARGHDGAAAAGLGARPGGPRGGARHQRATARTRASSATSGRGATSCGSRSASRTQALLLGGEPFTEPIVMWWNFVARSREEIDAAYTSWQQQDDRFGRLDSPLPRIPAPPPWWHRG
jgi:quercetin 2,3-dioxygenase